MRALGVAQVEYNDAHIYTDRLPSTGTLARLKSLLLNEEDAVNRVDRKQSAINATERIWPPLSVECANRLRNELTQAEIRLREIRREIVEMAAQIVNEDRVGEIVTT